MYFPPIDITTLVNAHNSILIQIKHFLGVSLMLFNLGSNNRADPDIHGVDGTLHLYNSQANLAQSTLQFHLITSSNQTQSFH